MLSQLQVSVGTVLLAAYKFKITPDSDKAPGGSGLLSAINIFAFYALLAAAGGFVIGAAAWAIGGRVGNDYTATQGKTGMVVALASAFLIGAAAGLLNIAYGLGSGA